MRHGAEAAHRPGDAVGGDAGRPAQGDGGENVEHVVLAEQGDVGAAHDRHRVAVLDRDDVAVADGGPVATAEVAAEEEHPGAGRRRHRPHGVVVGAEHHRAGRVGGLDEAALGGDIAVQRGVAVEVIRSDVEDRGQPAARPGHRFELERRQLEHHPVVPPHRVEPVEHGLADVPADVHPAATGGDDRAGERGGGGLAVGTGDADDGSRAAVEDELHLAAHRDAELASAHQDGRVPRHPRAGADQRRVVDDVVAVAAHDHLDATGKAARQRLAALVGVAAVDDPDVIALGVEHSRAGGAAAAHADHQCDLAAHDPAPMGRATSTASAAPAPATAAKRTTSACSRRPSSSKWWWIGLERKT